MKLLELDLHAYGPFTGTRLDLSAGSEGLHVIFGSNEAGKSSALRALKAFFYGIPERTADDFLHGKQDLRVGGRLRRADGTECIAYRRKGRKDTLLSDIDGDPLDSQLMTRLLAGVGDRLFATLFGIDHSSLVEGGKALLLEHGHEAQALFGSGLGSSAVHSLLETLETDAKDLFAPQASKPKINSLLKELKDIQRQQSDLSLSAREWDRARKALNRANEVLNNLEKQISESSKRRSFLERVRRTLPNLAKREGFVVRLSELQDIPSLPADFSKECASTVASRSSAAESRVKAQARLEALGSQIGKIDYSKDLLDQAEAIDDLRERLGSYRKATSDLPQLTSKRTSIRDTAIALLKKIRPTLDIEDFSELRDSSRARRRLTELGSRQESLSAAAESADAQLTQSKNDAKRFGEELAAIGDTTDATELRSAVARARGLGEIDDSIQGTAASITREFGKLQSQLDRLGLWQGKIDDLAAAPFPSQETVRHLVDTETFIREARGRAENERSAALEEIEKANEVLRRLGLTGQVPTEAQLKEIREKRDSVWGLLRRKWVGAEEVEAAAVPLGGQDSLPDVLETSIASSDEIADRLRREAQKVHENAAARARRKTFERSLAKIDSELQALVQQQQSFDDEWLQLWQHSKITPRSPREMAAWLGDALVIGERLEKAGERREQLGGQKEKRDRAIQELTATLAGLGSVLLPTKDGALRPILMQAETQLEILESTSRRRKQLEETCADLDRKIAQLEDGLKRAVKHYKDWKAKWHKETEALGLSVECTAADVSDYLDSVDLVASMLDETMELDQRIVSIHADNDLFASDVKRLIKEIAPDLSQLNAADAVMQLAIRLTENRKASTRLESLQQQSDSVRSEISEAEATTAATEKTLVSFCEQAECEKPEELSRVSRLATERDQLRGSLKSIEEELLEGGDGLSLFELEAESKKIDRDNVHTEFQQLSDQLDSELHPERRRLIEEKSAAERAFADMAGADEAARLANEAQQILSELRLLAERYVRNKVAGRVLRDQIEQFRQARRDPILTKASHYFVRLTCEAFSEITTTLDETDQPVLVAVRANGERLRVEGMSTGTRDQLYLALRLATLDHYIEGSEPLPFIVDDILIQFDDDRSSATLDTLADFSSRTQVILFTHHRQVVEQAKSVPTQQHGVFTHKLA